MSDKKEGTGPDIFGLRPFDEMSPEDQKRVAEYHAAVMRSAERANAAATETPTNEALAQAWTQGWIACDDYRDAWVQPKMPANPYRSNE